MADRSVCIALDGGGTKTTVACHTKDGEILGKYTSGATNPNSVGMENAFQNFKTGILEALKAGDRTLDDVVSVCLGMSGVDRPADKIRVTEWSEKVFEGRKIPLGIYNDGTIALACGSKGKLHGVVTIAGTGTIALGYNMDKNPDGGFNPPATRAAGMGGRLCDKGSGFDIGQQVLYKACCSEDGRCGPTKILPMLLEKMGWKSMQDCIAWAYGPEFSWDKFAALTPIAFTCANQGDEIAKEILTNAGWEIANSVRAVATRLGFKAEDEFSIVYAGGLLNSGVLVPYVQPVLEGWFPKANIVNSQDEPVMGAVYLNVQQKRWEVQQ